MSRAGRPRAMVLREPNGRASRSAERDEPVATARNYRLARGASNVEKLPNGEKNPAYWRAQEHGTLLGRLHVNGFLDLDGKNPDRAKDRYEAGVWYRRLWLDMRRAIEAPMPHVRAPGAPTGQGRPMEPDDARRAIAKEHRALLAVDASHRKVLYAVVVQEVETMHPMWLGPLTQALDALADHRARG